MADLPGDDIILCQITQQAKQGHLYHIPVEFADFANGSLPVSSNIRPTRIFTADKNMIIRKTGTLKIAVTNKVYQVLINLFK